MLARDPSSGSVRTLAVGVTLAAHKLLCSKFISLEPIESGQILKLTLTDCGGRVRHTITAAALEDLDAESLYLGVELELTND